MSSAFQNQVEVHWLANNIYYPDSILQPHKHIYYQFMYVMEGERIFRINDKKRRISKNMFLFAHPGVIHAFLPEDQTEPQDTVHLIECKFTVRNKELIQALQQVPPVAQGDEYLSSLLKRIYREAEDKKSYYANIVGNLATEFLYLTARRYNVHTLSGQSVDQSLNSPITTQIKDYIKEHYQREIPLEELSEITGYNRNYICRVFKKDVGQTIVTYINYYRVQRAAEMLIFTDIDIGDIATQCGFSDITYFTKTFKRFIGTPPATYRRLELVGINRVQGIINSQHEFLYDEPIELP